MAERIEGSGPSQLVQLIKSIGYNKDIDIELATVTSVSPLKIKVDNMKIELEGSDLIVAESLTTHSRSISLSGGTVNGSTGAGGSDGHTHSITDTSFTDATLTIQSPLTVNDRVIVANVNEGQTYIVLDKAVI